MGAEDFLQRGGRELSEVTERFYVFSVVVVTQL